MRCRRRKTFQIFIVVACLVFYVNFLLISRDTVSENQEPDQNHEKGAGLSNKNTVLRVKSDLTLHLPPPTIESIYPRESDYNNDRIRDQLKFVPSSVLAHRKSGLGEVPLKTIHLASGLADWGIKRGQQTFLDQECVVPHCHISDRRSKIADADVILFNGLANANLRNRSPKQIWLLYMLESPYHTPSLRRDSGLFNWTATYRRDSTIVAPYEKFVPYNDSVLTKPQTKNYAEGKTKMVAWFVSNCKARNNRMEYVKELAKHIEVDIYGHCGPLRCPRNQADKCFEKLNEDYRFYLSFENSNCRDYITEKFFINGLKHDVIPIVMGGAPEDYERVAPPHSYIHVDDFKTAKDLATYLHTLSTNQKLYNEYFQWKGTGDMINTYFWCRVCALAHDVESRGSSRYEDVNAWWRGGEVCIGDKFWRDVPNRPKIIGPFAKQQQQQQHHQQQQQQQRRR